MRNYFNNVEIQFMNWYENNSRLFINSFNTSVIGIILLNSMENIIVPR